MGQSLSVLCRDCKIDAYLGYGSGRMHIGGWKTTLQEYEEEVTRWKKMEPDTHGNERLREFLTQHDGHDVDYHGEYDAVRGNDLVYEDPFDSERNTVTAKDWNSYTKLYRDQ